MTFLRVLAVLLSGYLLLSACGSDSLDGGSTSFQEDSDSSSVEEQPSDSSDDFTRAVEVPLPDGGSVTCVLSRVDTGTAPAISCDWDQANPS